MKRPGVWLALVLIALPAALSTYRIIGLEYPLIPTAPGETWQLAVDLFIKTGGKDTQVALGLPGEQAGRIVVEERIISNAPYVLFSREGPNRIGIWTSPGDGEEKSISYRATIHIRSKGAQKPPPAGIGSYPSGFRDEDQKLAERLVAGWRSLSPPERTQAIAATAAGRWVDAPPGDEDLKAWMVLRDKLGKEVSLLALLRAGGLPAQTFEGLVLTEMVTYTPLRWIEVWDGQEWERLQIDSGERYPQKASLFPLMTGGGPALHVAGGELLNVRYVLSRQVTSQWRLHFERIRRSESFLDRWSLFRLPENYQGTFRILLLVPIGALMISALRNLVGFPTFGIFMPVLMALSFRDTGLYYGLGIFFGVVFLGYGIRLGLDKLRLLLVPRMSVLLTLVIASFTILALVGGKFGVREFMAVGLLPFVILTMVIERFFVLIEEAGAAQGIRTAAGSALVAIITYWIISWDPLQLTFFLYPELIAAVAALQIIVGQYSGYRLSEIFRFRRLVNP